MKKCYLVNQLFLAAVSLLFILSLTSCATQSEGAKGSSSIELEEITIADIQEAYAAGTYSIEELTKAYLDRIEAIDQNGPALHSVIITNPDAITIAQELDAELQAGSSRGPLHGIPVILKDNIDTHDKMPTTAGSRALANSFPLQDAFLTKQLRAAGAIILGKANLSEWANFRGQMSSSGWSGVGGQTKNPYVTTRNPCGSSSGSGVSVSANLTILAVGTETNGSIVCPSHANGIVGIKPTVGLISRSGVIPISFTQDTPGPMARTVRDAAIGLGAMVGIDENDSKTLDSESKTYSDYTQFLNADGLQGKRIGIYQAPLGNHYKVDSLFAQAVAFMKEQGAEIIELERLVDGIAGRHSFEIMLYEYKDGLNNYFASLGEAAPIKDVEELIAFNKADSIELKYHDQRYLEMAQEKGSLEEEEYQTALQEMMRLSREEGIDKVMEELDLQAIIAPTGSPAWQTDWTNGDHFQLGSSSPAARAGYPNITVPMGFVDEVPVGISFFGQAWTEPLLLEIAYSFEQGTKHRKAPRFLPAD
ncbi:MAG: amidase [Bacteroidota bacterium]